MAYQRRASPLHAARASVAGAYCLVLAVAPVVFAHPLLLVVLLATLAAVAAAARVAGVIGSALRLGVPIGLAFALLNPLWSQNGLTVLVRVGNVAPFGEIDVTLEALAYGAIIALKVIAIVLGARIASACVDPDELLRSFRRVSFHSALTAALATRMIPVLAGDARRLAEAQRCRPDGGAQGVRGRVAIVAAVMANALDRAIDVAATLEVRGYGSARRAPRVERPWSRHDLAFAASAAALAALAAAGSLWGWGRFDAYPLVRGPVGATTIALCLALPAVALAPFADRRGIDR